MKLDFSLAFAWLTGLCVFAALLTWIGGPQLALFIVCALLVNLLISVAVGKFAHWQDTPDHAQSRASGDGMPERRSIWATGRSARRRTDVDETELEREAREYAEGETPMTDAEIDAAARFHFFGEGEG